MNYLKTLGHILLIKLLWMVSPTLGWAYFIIGFAIIIYSLCQKLPDAKPVGIEERVEK